MVFEPAHNGFISLFEALLEVGKLLKIPANITPNSIEEDAWRRTEAAGLLWTILCNADAMGVSLKWFRLSIATKRPFIDDQVVGDGTNILLWTALRGRTIEKAKAENDVRMYEEALAAVTDPGGLASEGLVQSLQKKPLEYVIGFERSAFETFIAKFLPQEALEHNLEENNRPLPQQLWQEQKILQVIRELGYEPTSLPQRTPGKSGVKALVREKLVHSNRQLWRQTIFDDAWKRLRRMGEIAEGETKI